MYVCKGKLSNPARRNEITPFHFFNSLEKCYNKYGNCLKAKHFTSSLSLIRCIQGGPRTYKHITMSILKLQERNEINPCNSLMAYLYWMWLNFKDFPIDLCVNTDIWPFVNTNLPMMNVRLIWQIYSAVVKPAHSWLHADSVLFQSL